MRGPVPVGLSDAEECPIFRSTSNSCFDMAIAGQLHLRCNGPVLLTSGEIGTYRLGSTAVQDFSNYT